MKCKELKGGKLKGVGVAGLFALVLIIGLAIGYFATGGEKSGSAEDDIKVVMVEDKWKDFEPKEIKDKGSSSEDFKKLHGNDFMTACMQRSETLGDFMDYAGYTEDNVRVVDRNSDFGQDNTLVVLVGGGKSAIFNYTKEATKKGTSKKSDGSQEELEIKDYKKLLKKKPTSRAFYDDGAYLNQYKGITVEQLNALGVVLYEFEEKDGGVVIHTSNPRCYGVAMDLWLNRENLNGVTAWRDLFTNKVVFAEVGDDSRQYTRSEDGTYIIHSIE